MDEFGQVAATIIDEGRLKVEANDEKILNVLTQILAEAKIQTELLLHETGFSREQMGG